MTPTARRLLEKARRRVQAQELSFFRSAFKLQPSLVPALIVGEPSNDSVLITCYACAPERCMPVREALDFLIGREECVFPLEISFNAQTLTTPCKVAPSGPADELEFKIGVPVHENLVRLSQEQLHTIRKLPPLNQLELPTTVRGYSVQRQNVFLREAARRCFPEEQLQQLNGAAETITVNGCSQRFCIPWFVLRPCQHSVKNDVKYPRTHTENEALISNALRNLRLAARCDEMVQNPSAVLRREAAVQLLRQRFLTGVPSAGVLGAPEMTPQLAQAGLSQFQNNADSLRDAVLLCQMERHLQTTQ